jgi:hypothetical protein
MASAAGLIAVAAADERVIAHPAQHAGITTNLLLYGVPVTNGAVSTAMASSFLNGPGMRCGTG